MPCVASVHTLRWRHNDHAGVSNHQPHGCLLNRLFRQKTSKLRVTGLCAGNSPGPVNSPHNGPVTRKMFPFDDVIMIYSYLLRHVARQPCSWHSSNYEVSVTGLTHWPLGDLNAILKMEFSILFFWLVSWDFLMIMPSDECHRISLMISQHWFR